jgi:hypothetical protein
MEQRITEKDLVYNLTQALLKVDDLKQQLETATEVKNKAENALMELLESMSADATARYENLGYFRLMTPRLYANVTKDREAELFDYLEEINRTDLKKTVVMPQTLSAFVKELIDTGVPVPEFIGYYLRPSLRLYK